MIKLLKTHKYAWKEYFLTSIFILISLIGIIVLTSVFAPDNEKSFDFFFTFINNPMLFLSLYFSTHFVAQSYKYALSQMEPNRFISEEIKETP